MSEKNEVAVLEPEQMEIVPVGDVSIMDKLLTAVSNGMDITMVEKFMDLAERNEANEARRAYNRAFAAFKANPPEIVKDKLVDYPNKGPGRTKYKHATIGAVVGAIIKGMSEHGLSHNWKLDQPNNQVKVTCVITHELGHSESTALTAGADTSGGKNSIQAISSTVTYLERYTLQAATGIAVLDEDDDGNGHKEPTIDCAYWETKMDKEAQKTLGGIKTWKAKNIKEINKMPEGQEKTDTLRAIDDMLKEYTPSEQTSKAAEKPADRTNVDSCLNYLKSEAVSSSLDSFIEGWNAHIAKNLAALPADQQKELTDLKAEIEVKFQGE